MRGGEDTTVRVSGFIGATLASEEDTDSMMQGQSWNSLRSDWMGAKLALTSGTLNTSGDWWVIAHVIRRSIQSR